MRPLILSLFAAMIACGTADTEALPPNTDGAVRRGVDGGPIPKCNCVPVTFTGNECDCLEMTYGCEGKTQTMGFCHQRYSCLKDTFDPPTGCPMKEYDFAQCTEQCVRPRPDAGMGIVDSGDSG